MQYPIQVHVREWGNLNFISSNGQMRWLLHQTTVTQYFLAL